MTPQEAWAEALTVENLCALLSTPKRKVDTSTVWTVTTRDSYFKLHERIITAPNLLTELRSIADGGGGPRIYESELKMRAVDRMRQLLKRANLIQFNRSARLWSVTPCEVTT